MTKATCIQCDRKILARGMCPTHYNLWFKVENAERNTFTCNGCSEEFNTWRVKQAYCSLLCQRQAALKTARVGRLAQMEARPNLPRYVHEDPEVKEARRLGSRGPLRAAHEDMDYLAVIEAIKANSSPNADGCWQWLGRINKNGYPIAKIAGRTMAVHRISLEAKHCAPLGGQAAHHKCANTNCVNPDHLQAVTHRENTAEMLARNYYIARIRQLEDALSTVEPTSPLLMEVGIA